MSSFTAILFPGQGSQTPELRDLVVEAVPRRETMLALNRLGADRFVEVGPGRVLTGVANRTLNDVELVNA